MAEMWQSNGKRGQDTAITSTRTRENLEETGSQNSGATNKYQGMLWEPNRRTRITHEASLTTPSSWLSRQNAQPIPATSSHASTCRSPSAAAIHRGMMIPLVFAVSFPFFIPLGVSEVTPRAPVLHDVCIRAIHVRVHIHIRAGRSAHMGPIARPLRPLCCVPRRCGLAFSGVPVRSIARSTLPPGWH